MSKENKKRSYRNNQVRIVGGILRGRIIQFPSAVGLRPTADSVRERLFNWLGQDLTGKIILDLFAGSGALGLESASRFAKHVVLCDNNPLVIQQLRQYQKSFDLLDKVDICQQDGLRYLRQTTLLFDLVLLDPPFAWQDWSRLFQCLKEKLNIDAYVYLEAGQLPDIPEWLYIKKQGKAGQSLYLLLHYVE